MTEKRRYPRYTCSGGVDIHILETPVHAWGNIGDLSRGGVYVEIAETLPLGSKVEVRVEVQDIAVHATGTIVTCHPGVGVGVTFTQLDEQNRADLGKIMQDLESVSQVTS
jgi:hypothetical protein